MAIATSKWIESDGGPLMVASGSVAPAWSGTRPSKRPAEASDYRRACAIRDDVGTVSIGVADALILGDEPDSTTVIASEGDIFLVRRRCADSEDALRSKLHPALTCLPFMHACSFRTVPGDHFLFDSAYPWDEVEEAIKLWLPASIYSVATAHFAPDTSLSVLVHRLRRM
ncbi:MAG: hypothetical protein HOQ01_02895 [Lysobacter sp.]|nr:hypothetical protein [Lysobacter sp.]